jgi:hypothetical protein
MPVIVVISGGIGPPGSSNHSEEPRTFIDPPGLTVILEEADAELDELVAIGIGAGGFHVHDSGDELWNVIGRVVFGQEPQPTGDAIIAALDERAGHLFQRVLHVGGIANSTAVFNPLHQDGTARFDLLMTSGRLEPFGTLVTPTPPTMLTRTNTAPLPASTAPRPCARRIYGELSRPGTHRRHGPRPPDSVVGRSGYRFSRLTNPGHELYKAPASGDRSRPRS